MTKNMNPINRKALLFDSDTIDDGKSDQFNRRAAELRAELKSLDPEAVARNTLSEILVDQEGETKLILQYWNNQFECIIPGYNFNKAGKNRPASDFDQMMLLYYLSTADGSTETGKFISFSELPDGRFYNQAYQSYTSQPPLQNLGESIERFNRAAKALGGIEYPLGNSAFIFRVFARVKVLCVLWLGDEDFASSYRILFDSSAPHYLPTDDYTILGSRLTRNLIAANS